MTWCPMASRNRVELKWRRLRGPFAFFLWPNERLGLRDTGIIEGKALIRQKEYMAGSPFAKNTIMSIIARTPASLRYGLQKTSGSHMVFVKYFGVRQLKGWGKAKPRFFVTAVSPRREKEILTECGISRACWP